MSRIFIGHIRDTAEGTERLDLERAQIDFKLDTWAQAITLPFKVYRVLKTNCSPPARFLQEFVVVKSYSEAQLKLVV